MVLMLLIQHLQNYHLTTHHNFQQNLDTNSQNIIVDTAHGILDENSNEQIIFTTTGSAVNEFTLANAATGNAPELSAGLVVTLI